MNLKRISAILSSLVIAATFATASLAGQYGKDIVDTAVSAGNFKTLATALKAAGLVNTLKGDGPFTVFAPTDEAFAKIPKETLESILADKEKLTQILTYHVVPGKVMAADVVDLSSAKTVQGQSITIDTSSGVMVDNANVVTTRYRSFQWCDSCNRYRYNPERLINRFISLLSY